MFNWTRYEIINKIKIIFITIIKSYFIVLGGSAVVGRAAHRAKGGKRLQAGSTACRALPVNARPLGLAPQHYCYRYCLRITLLSRLPSLFYIYKIVDAKWAVSCLRRCWVNCTELCRRKGWKVSKHLLFNIILFIHKREAWGGIPSLRQLT